MQDKESLEPVGLHGNIPPSKNLGISCSLHSRAQNTTVRNGLDPKTQEKLDGNTIEIRSFIQSHWCSSASYISERLQAQSSNRDLETTASNSRVLHVDANTITSTARRPVAETTKSTIDTKSHHNLKISGDDVSHLEEVFIQCTTEIESSSTRWRA